MKKKKPTWEDVIQVAKNKGMTPTEFIKMLINNNKQLGLNEKKFAGPTENHFRMILSCILK